MVRCGWSFAARRDRYSFDARVSPKELIGRIKSLRERFAHVSISNESFEKSIKRWDKENTFLYLDPPYVGAEDVYSDIGEFGVAQHIQLSEILKESKATWMLSYGDNALVRELYKGFPMKEAKVLYSGLGNSGDNQHEASELIITNYEPTETQEGLFAP